MSVKLELYRVFKEVAEAGNITAAAQALYISQSAVSQSIKQLEGRAADPSVCPQLPWRGPDTGRPDAVRVRPQRHRPAGDRRGEAVPEPGAADGTPAIGASDTVTSQFLLPYLDRFHRQYPAIHIQIVSGRSHKVLGLLQSGKVDIAFASTPQESASLETHPCFATHSVFVAAADYPCDFGHVYSLAEIAAFPLILLERKASSRLYLEKYFLQNGQRLHPEIELGARSLLVDLAAIGFGVAGVTEEFGPRRAVERSTAEAGYGLRDPAPQRGSVRPAGRASDPRRPSGLPTS